MNGSVAVVKWVCQAAVMIVKNGAMVATVWAESLPRWSTSTNVAVLRLDRDEQVWLLRMTMMMVVVVVVGTKKEEKQPTNSTRTRRTGRRRRIQEDAYRAV